MLTKKNTMNEELKPKKRATKKKVVAVEPTEEVQAMDIQAIDDVAEAVEVQEEKSLEERKLERELTMKDRFVAVNDGDGEVIMVSKADSVFLKKLKETEGVKIINWYDFKERFTHMTPEQITDMEDKLDALIVLDELDEVNHEVISSAYGKKIQEQEAYREEVKKRRANLTSKGYAVAMNNKFGVGTIKKNTASPQHQERNAPCACGSGKKFKKCCLPKYLSNATVSPK